MLVINRMTGEAVTILLRNRMTWRGGDDINTEQNYRERR